MKKYREQRQTFVNVDGNLPQLLIVGYFLFYFILSNFFIFYYFYLIGMTSHFLFNFP